MIDAEVIVRLFVPDICDQDDLDAGDTTLESLVRWLVREEGLCSIVADDYEIIEVREVSLSS